MIKIRSVNWLLGLALTILVSVIWGRATGALALVAQRLRNARPRDAAVGP